jgi:hypothetical protein
MSALTYAGNLSLVNNGGLPLVRALNADFHGAKLCNIAG